MTPSRTPDPFYKSRRWVHLRNAVLRRDQYQDQIEKRYKLITKEAECVHHIFPREWWPEYQWEPWNLTSLTIANHNRLHDRETNRLTADGMKLLRRTARKRGMDLNEELKKYPKG